MERQLIETLADALCRNAEAFKDILDALGNGIVLTNADSTILYVNPAFSKRTGYSFDEIVGQQTDILYSGRHTTTYYKTLWHDLIKKHRWEGDIWNRRKNGEICPQHLVITQLQDDKANLWYLAVFSEISVLHLDANSKINLAFHDPLTQLCNFSLFEEKFNEAAELYRRNHFLSADKDQLAILYINIDDFKTVNDDFGYLAGDDVLIHVGQSLVEAGRDIDTVARLGRDEFLVLLSNVKSAADVWAFSERLEQHLNAGKKIKGKYTIPNISMGTSFYPVCSDAYEALIAQAKEAMCFSKKNGRYLSFYRDFV